jgi:hypothetical protein
MSNFDDIAELVKAAKAADAEGDHEGSIAYLQQAQELLDTERARQHRRLELLEDYQR